MSAALLVFAVLAAADNEQPTWSIGAGLSFTALRVGTDDPNANAVRDLPNASLAIERWVGGRTWLLLGLRGGIAEDKSQPETEPVSMISVASWTSAQQVAAALGVRQSLLPESAPVDLSLIAILSFGYERSVRGTTTTRPNPLGSPLVDTTTQVNNLGSGGLGLGISVERRLVEYLGLRFTLGLAQVSYASGRRVQGQNPTTISTLSAGISLQPGLELRFYF